MNLALMTETIATTWMTPSVSEDVIKGIIKDKRPNLAHALDCLTFVPEGEEEHWQNKSAQAALKWWQDLNHHWKTWIFEQWRDLHEAMDDLYRSSLEKDEELAVAQPNPEALEGVELLPRHHVRKALGYAEEVAVEEAAKDEPAPADDEPLSGEEIQQLMMSLVNMLSDNGRMTVLVLVTGPDPDGGSKDTAFTAGCGNQLTQVGLAADFILSRQSR